MAESKVDWSELRGAMALFVVCLMVSAAMLSASYYFRQDMTLEYERNHKRFRNASQQYLAVDEEERIIERFYPEFVRLYRAGLLGQERRLNWLETLKNAGEGVDIPELGYEIESRRVMESKYGLALGRYDLYVSLMNLNLGLLHEGDLFKLLGALDRDARGQYSVNSCEFRLRSSELQLDSMQPNIQAECQLGWLTVDLSGDEGLEL